MTNAEKKVVKAARDIIEEPYRHCLLDGRKEKVGNFRVEPPGLFRGRGEHPKTGLLKVSCYLDHRETKGGQSRYVSWTRLTFLCLILLSD